MRVLSKEVYFSKYFEKKSKIKNKNDVYIKNINKSNKKQIKRQKCK